MAAAPASPGVTYRNECEAIHAWATTAYPGPCKAVRGVRFLSADLVGWDPTPGATGYHVYLDGDQYAVESGGVTCQASRLSTTPWSIPSIPNVGELWQIEVTAQYSEGEGPMGIGSLCRSRSAAESCGN